MAETTSGEDQDLIPIVFHGKATEYFGIFIVNVVLTLFTLGLYGPWAKVRAQRYFYGNTELAGDRFKYAAKGSQILLGRIIVVGAGFTAALLVALIPILALIVYPALFFLFPWLVSRALKFRARVSRWRNIGFDFDAGYWPAFVALYIFPLITVFTAGLGAPVATKLYQEWAYNRFRFGDRPFTLEMPLGPLYLLFFAVVLMAVFAFTALIGVFTAVLGLGGEDLAASGASSILVATVLTMVLLGLVYQAGVRNIAFSHAVLDGRHRLRSTISKSRYAWIVVSNALISVLTLGLMLPWARIRLARFIASETALIPAGSLDDFVEGVHGSQGVIGEEYVELEGIDVGIGL